MYRVLKVSVVIRGNNDWLMLLYNPDCLSVNTRIGSSPIKGPRCFIEQETFFALNWLVPGPNSSVISQTN